MNVSATLKKYGLEKAFDYLRKEPEQNLRTLFHWAERMGRRMYPRQLAQVRAAIEDPDNPFHGYARHLIDGVDPEVLKTAAVNFFIHENMIGWKQQEAMRKKHGCNIPWAVLLDPTSACNLRCVGCWAAEYGSRLNLSFEEIDGIIRQGKALGIYVYIYTGGEPLVRAPDLIRLCEAHGDCLFLCFTNGTLIDGRLADDMLRVKNFVPAISLEGMREQTDARRGGGTFDRAVRAMDMLHDRRLLYGVSTCYTSDNCEAVTSEAYFDLLIDRGAHFIWFFHYMPVGGDAEPRLLLSPAQREQFLPQGKPFVHVENDDTTPKAIMLAAVEAVGK